MAAHNPYAPSKASLQSGEPTSPGGGLWRSDDELIVAHGAVFACAITAIVKSRILYPKRTDERYARLKGADESFLASLPSYVPY